jgi:hypothetical protein
MYNAIILYNEYMLIKNLERKKRGEPSGRSSDHWGCGLKGILRPWPLPVLTVLFDCHQISGFAALCASHQEILLYHRPKADEANRP